MESYVLQPSDSSRNLTEFLQNLDQMEGDLSIQALWILFRNISLSARLLYCHINSSKCVETEYPFIKHEGLIRTNNKYGACNSLSSLLVFVTLRSERNFHGQQ